MMPDVWLAHGRIQETSKEHMSDQPSPGQRSLANVTVTRRRVVRGMGLGAAGVGLAATGIRASGQGAIPDSSPISSSEGTPLPSAVPETSLTIARDQRPEYRGMPQPGTDLRMYIRREDLHRFSPTAQRQDFQALISLLDPLVWIDSVTMEPRPWLATSWEWSSDGLMLTFQLRDDVLFHDGSPLTAEDVRFSFIAYRDDYDSAMANFFALITDVAVDGPHTVRVIFAKPDGAFLFNGASQLVFSSAQYLPYWESMPVGERSLSNYDWATTAPLGTGPWQFAGMRDESLLFGRFDAYWNRPPHFDRLELIAEDDQQARLEGWKDGDVDIVYPVRATEMDGLWDEEGTLFVAEAPVAFFAAFNFANPANVTADMMGDPALRQALTLTVDRTGYAGEIFFGFIDEMKAGTVTQPWAHESSIENPKQDIEAANRILDEGGWRDVDGDGMREDAVGNRLDLYCIVSNSERPELLAILEGLKEDFSKIGARLTVERLDPDVLDDRWVQNRMYDMVAFSLIQYPAFAEYDLYGTAWDIRVNRMGWNPGGYSDEVVDTAIQQYFGAWLQPQMKAALSTLQIAANEDLFGLWFGFPHDLVLVRPDIQGFQPHKYFQTWNTRLLWRGEPFVETPAPSPAATPVASPVGSPGATPVVEPDGTPGATPVASPVASPQATPMASPVASVDRGHGRW